MEKNRTEAPKPALVEEPRLSTFLRKCLYQKEGEQKRAPNWFLTDLTKAYRDRKRWISSDVAAKKGGNSKFSWRYFQVANKNEPDVEIRRKMERMYHNLLEVTRQLLGDDVSSEMLHLAAFDVYSLLSTQSIGECEMELQKRLGVRSLPAAKLEKAFTICTQLYCWRATYCPQEKENEKGSNKVNSKKDIGFLAGASHLNQQASERFFCPDLTKKEEFLPIEETFIPVEATPKGASAMEGMSLVDWLRLHVEDFVSNRGGMTISEVTTQILTILRTSKSGNQLQHNLVELLGMSYLDFVRGLIERRFDLMTLAIGMDSTSKSKAAITASSVAPGFIIRTEEEKMLEKMRRKAEKKKKQRGGGGNETDPSTSGNRNLNYVDRVELSRQQGDLRQLTQELEWASSEIESTGASKKTGMPEGTIHNDKPGFEEFIIPAPPPRFRRPGEKIPKEKEEADEEEVDDELVPISRFDHISQLAFQGISSLNRVQSRVFYAAYNTNENLLICAPTGAGKTNVAMMTVLQEVMQNTLGDSVASINKNAFKVVYVAPMKALAAEMTASFGSRLAPLGLSVRELTGDMQMTKREIKETQMIVTTPEKWDVITRKTSDNELVKSVRLLIIDEVHLLHEQRGPVIEALVARTIRLVESSQSMIRIVGLSATLPNYKDVAEFLRVSPANGLFYFDSSWRPVPLKQHFVGVKEKNPARRVEKMTEICFDKCLPTIELGKQVMIFVHSRKDTVKTALAMIDLVTAGNHLKLFTPDDDDPKHKKMAKGMTVEFARREAQKSRNKELKSVFPYGFGIHHAGMLRSDRNLVEKMFSRGMIKVLVCTATLAWGVNLPAHFVIIKGTKVYKADQGGFSELGMLDVMQIFGRAGRPQFDKAGQAAILTEHATLRHYTDLLTNQLPIESKFLNHMIDNLNAEVVLGTVSNTSEAVVWLSYTYLFVRAMKNPLKYGITQLDLLQDPSLMNWRKKWIKSAAEELNSCKMVRYESVSGQLGSTAYGRAASHYYLHHETVRVFDKHLKKIMTLDELLAVLCMSVEFEQIKNREEEAIELHQLTHDACFLDVKGGGQDNTWGKVSILFQAFVMGARITEFSLVSDTAYVADNSARILRGMFEIAIAKEWSGTAKQILELSKCLDRRCPPDAHPLRQFNLLPFEVMSKLETTSFSVQELLDMENGEIGELVRHRSMGGAIRRLCRQLPSLKVSALVQPITREVVRVIVDMDCDFLWNDKVHGLAERWWVWLEDPKNFFVYHHELFTLDKADRKETQHLNLTIPIFDSQPSQYLLHIVSDRWLGAETVVPINGKFVLPDDVSPHTPLLDLRPLPTSVLKKKEYMDLYPYTYFNAVQTQIFWTLFHTDVSVLVGAPTGSGKTVAAELAILRELELQEGEQSAFEEEEERKGGEEKQNGEKENQKGKRRKKGMKKIVYIGPMKALVHERVKDWTKRFGNLGVEVIELTGEASPSPDLLRRADILCTTPEKWDGTSRQWHARGYVRQTRLIIIDEIHLLGQDRGPILEVIVSRMRYVATQTGQPVRFVGLSTALANARDVADWIGVPKMGLYNFRPAVRPVPLETHIQGFAGQHYCPRMATMNKPAYAAICVHSRDKPVLVFVSSRRQTRLTAQDLMSLAMADEAAPSFLRISEKQLQRVLMVVHDTALKNVLPFGIGIHHAGLNARDKSIVEELFKTGKIQILISTATLAWGVNLPAHLVVIKGTEFFDPKTKRYVDMPITDVLQMMGRAGRPQFDKSGTAVVLVHAPKKPFYSKFLYNPFPVESALLEEDGLNDHINAEIATGTISTIGDGVDYLTWTFFYRRLVRNPSYYGLEDSSPSSISSFLSSTIEGCLYSLRRSKCVEVEDGVVSPTTLGRIAAYYYMSHKTLSLFGEELGESDDDEAYTSSLSIETLLSVLSRSSEYDGLPVRHNEDGINEEIAEFVRYEPTEPMDDPHCKTSLLLQHHFSRLPLPISDYNTDLKSVLDQAIRIVQAMVDVAADAGRLFTALQCMHLSQCVVQGRWFDDSTLSTLPHLDSPEVLTVLAEHKIVCLPQLVVTKRENLRQWLCSTPRGGKSKEGLLNRKNFDELFGALEQIPNLFVTHKLKIAKQKDEEEGKEGEEEGVAELEVEVRRPRGSDVVYAPRYPKKMRELWWLVVGDPQTGELLALKRINIERRVFRTTLTFDLPETSGPYSYHLYFMSGTYLGLDQQYEISFDL